MKKLIVVGNVYFDHNIYGIELDIHANLQTGTEYRADSGEIVIGGSAVNVAMQATKLEMGVSFIGKVGDDEFGLEIKKLFEKKNIDSSLLTKSEFSTSISVNLIFKKDGDFVGAHYGEASKHLNPSDFDFNHPLLVEGGLIYFGGTAKQPLLFQSLPTLFAKLKKIGFTIFFDPNRLPVGKEIESREQIAKALPYVDYYLPNETEILQFANSKNLDNALEATLKYGAKNIIVKTGPKGCRVKTNKIDITIDGEKIIPINTVGAGDSFNAALISQLANGADLESAAKFANKCASIKVSDNIWPTKKEVNL